MARLVGKVRDRPSFKLVETSLDIWPVTPSALGPRDAYKVCVGPSPAGIIVEVTLCLEGSQWAHEDVRQMAEMFAEAELLFRAEHRQAGRLAVNYGLCWADVWIVRAASRPERMVDVFVYLFDRECADDKECGEYIDRCTAFVIGVPVADAVEFGNDLIEELIGAWKLRKSLGISTDDEVENWPEYFANDPKWARYFVEDEGG